MADDFSHMSPKTYELNNPALHLQGSQLPRKRKKPRLRDFMSNRLWWFLMVICSILVCAFFIRQVYIKWDETPVIVSFAETSNSVWHRTNWIITRDVASMRVEWEPSGHCVTPGRTVRWPNVPKLRSETPLELFCLLAAAAVSAYKNPYYAAGRSVNVHLFEWKWDDIANECERFLGPKGYGGIQISPPNENVVLWTYNRPWWERYQPLSYALVTRSGDERQFADMVRRCNAAGVRIYVDAVINHMTGEHPENYGTAGNTAVFHDWYYPTMSYTREHFNWPHCVIDGMDYANNAWKVRNCELVRLKDLNQANEHVMNMIVDFMNKLIDYGVAGFRIDAAKHMWPKDLRIIYDRLNNLNTAHGFPSNARPYIYQEVIDYGEEAISRDEYTPIATVTEFKVGMELSNCFRGNNQLRLLVSWGLQWGLVAHSDALTFIENHDNERGHGGGGGILTYKESRPYKAAIAFLLAHPYGEPQIMSSFDFWDPDAGPPMDRDGNIISPAINSDDTCGNGWICQHRWRQIYAMVGFRNAAGTTTLNDWWDNGSNQIAFCRGGNAFIAFNNDMWNLNQNLQTCLPAGTYCDVISGNKVGGSCQGKSVTVGNDGRAQISVGANEYDLMLAIHVGPESRL